MVLCSGHHRLYAVWYFNFCLTEKGELFRTPPALRRVVLQLLPNGKGKELFRTPPALRRVVLQLLPNGKGRTLPGHHRLYAVWYFNFGLQWRKVKAL